MNREEMITKIQNDINKFSKNCEEDEREMLSKMFDDVEKLRRPVTLAEFLGWEQGVEYEFFDKTLYKTIDNQLYYFNTTTKEWYLSCFKFCNYEISRLRQAKKFEEKKYYAKIKGNQLVEKEDIYWNYSKKSNSLCISDIDCRISPNFVIAMTINEWNELGINDSNADFEEVE